MNKKDFIILLKDGLSCLPKSEVEEHLTFYNEMIDDRIEEGLTEEEAVLAIGNVKDIIAQITADSATNKEIKTPKKGLKWWVILLLALGSPIWISLGISALAVIFSLYAVIWSVLISLWGAELSFIGSSVLAFATGFALIFEGSTLIGSAMLGVAIFLAGLSIFLFFGCKATTKLTLRFTKQIAIWVKKCFSKKEEVK